MTFAPYGGGVFTSVAGSLVAPTPVVVSTRVGGAPLRGVLGGVFSAFCVLLIGVGGSVAELHNSLTIVLTHTRSDAPICLKDPAPRDFPVFLSLLSTSCWHICFAFSNPILKCY